MNMKRWVLFTMLMAALSACQLTGPSAKDLAATMVAETAEAMPPSATPTIAPTETTAPTPTITPTSAPTFTSTPTGPLVVKDDFSAKTDIWGACDKCEWKDGKLYFGTFPPRGQGINQVFEMICEACGQHSYFRIAADVAFADGVAGDRVFGVGMIDPGKFYAGTGISTSQVGVLEAYDFETSNWTGSDYQLYGAVNPGVASNRVEFIVKPNKSGGADYYSVVNGKTIIFLSNVTKRAINTLKPAVYLGWHSVGITVDNFEYEELVP